MPQKKYLQMRFLTALLLGLCTIYLGMTLSDSC